MHYHSVSCIYKRPTARNTLTQQVCSQMLGRHQWACITPIVEPKKRPNQDKKMEKIDSSCGGAYKFCAVWKVKVSVEARKTVLTQGGSSIRPNWSGSASSGQQRALYSPQAKRGYLMIHRLSDQTLQNVGAKTAIFAHTDCPRWISFTTVEMDRSLEVWDLGDPSWHQL